MKKIEEMNIEELRSLVRDLEAEKMETEKALEEAKKSAETYKVFWDMNERDNKQLKAKIEAIKAVASLF